MADGYIGEIRIFPYQYAPEGWYECNGQVLNIHGNEALYAVIGNIYGGSPPSTFALPNLQGYVPAGIGQGPGLSQYTLGYKYGATTETISGIEMASHSHTITVKIGKNDPAQGGNTVYLSDPAGADLNIPSSRSNSTQNYVGQLGYSTASTASTYLAAATLAAAGGNATGVTVAHANEQPYLVFRFCICWNGIYPIHP